MYLDHFGLKERPFSIAPDPRYLFMSQQHREALAHLLYGIGGEGGFVLVTGEVGTGKTTVCRCLLGQLPEACQVAYVINPRLTPEELLETVCDEFRIPYPEGKSYSKLLVDRINQFLLEAHAEGRNPVLIIDEAQNLSVEVLEQVRLLTNLETDQRKLLQVVLIGQPELRELLARTELRQLAQRITARFHLGALTKNELEGYVRHRLAVAGLQHPVFHRRLLDLIHRRTGGVPRLVNLVCDRALLGSYVEGELQVGRRTLRKAMGEVFGEEGLPQKRRRWLLTLLMLVLVAAGAGAWWLLRGDAAPGRFRIAGVPGVASSGMAAKVATADPVPAAAQLGDWLLALPARETAEPFRDLLQIWGLEPPPGPLTEPCATAAAGGLSCLSLQGDLQTLRRLNRPAILNLGPATRPVLITRLDQDRCRLRLGDASREFSLSQLEAHWTGALTLFWKAPADYRAPLHPGDQGEQVRRLLAPYSALFGYDATRPLPDSYDGALLADVRRFQAAAGLAESGEIGPQTLIVLNRQVTDSGPRLY